MRDGFFVLMSQLNQIISSAFTNEVQNMGRMSVTYSH